MVKSNSKSIYEIALFQMKIIRSRNKRKTILYKNWVWNKITLLKQKLRHC